MTVEATTLVVTRHSYTGPGNYTFPFRIFDDTDLVVKHTTTDGVISTLTLNTDYTVTYTAGDVTGTCVMSYTSTTGYLDLYSDIPVTQSVDYVNNNALDVNIIERSFDRVTLIMQQFELDISGAIANSNWQGDWVTGTDYVLRDLVRATSDNLYICTAAHTAAPLFSTDLDNGNWALYVDVESVETAQTAAEAAQTGAETAETNAGVSEDNSASSAAICASIEAAVIDCLTTTHTIASHSDTTATGAELETLTDGSNSDSLHKHAKLHSSIGVVYAEVDGGDLVVGDTSLGTGGLSIPYGSIAVNGTVNGRDVATDGTKLDGIATSADVSSGLEEITENSQTGWRLVGRDAANYGDIGDGAVDLSMSDSSSTPRGATGDYSFASGFNVTASGNESNASGDHTTASGSYSHAEGRLTFAIGLYSHAEGYISSAEGAYSHAEGQGSVAAGDGSHAAGNTTKANGRFSHSSGEHTIAQNNYSFAVGKYNVGTDTGTILEVGIGTDSSHKANGLEVHTDGKVLMPNLPTSDPTEAGALWNDSGTLKISAG